MFDVRNSSNLDGACARQVSPHFSQRRELGKELAIPRTTLHSWIRAAGVADETKLSHPLRTLVATARLTNPDRAKLHKQFEAGQAMTVRRVEEYVRGLLKSSPKSPEVEPDLAVPTDQELPP